VIPHSKPVIGELEISAALEVIRSGMLSSGLQTARLESALEKVLTRNVACVSSGTAALHMALLSLGITEGMKVAIPTHCCPSVLYALRYVGATPVLFDCGVLGYGSAPNAVAGLAHLVNAVVVVHQYGIPDIHGVSEKTSVPLIEDCAAALGARIGTAVVGNSGVLAIFSFFATKLIAGGECGAVAGDSDLVDWIRTRRTPRGADSECTHYPYSPSDICSAIALTQLKQHQHFVDARTRLADAYSTELRNHATIPVIPEHCFPVWHRYIISTHKPREEVIRAARKKEICIGYGVRTPIHRLLKMNPTHFVNSEKAYEYSISLPLYPDLTSDQQEQVISFLKGFV